MQKTFSRIIAALGSVYLLQAACHSIASSWSVNNCAAAAADNTTEKLWHPVLNLGSQLIEPHGQASDYRELKTNLDDAAFRKMINLPIPDGTRDIWARAFGQVEMDAAAQLCTRLKGLSKDAVEKLLGPPAFTTPSPLCFKKQHDETHRLYLIYGGSEESFEAMDDNWLYFFGGRPMLVRPMFRDGVCIDATASTYDCDYLYNSWRGAQLEHFAVGKTVPEIVKFEDEPPSYALNGKLEEWKSDGRPFSTFDDWLKVPHLTIRYQFGKWRIEEMVIERGHCINAYENHSYHFTAGSSMRAHEPYQATFEMPRGQIDADIQVAAAKEKRYLDEAPLKYPGRQLIRDSVTGKWKFGPAPGLIRLTPTFPKGVLTAPPAELSKLRGME